MAEYFETMYGTHRTDDACDEFFATNDTTKKLALFRQLAIHDHRSATKIADQVTRRPWEFTRRVVEQSRGFLKNPESWRKPSEGACSVTSIVVSKRDQKRMLGDDWRWR